jgi:5-methyltetrahydrofolate--homocysteine methyltransferase
VIGGQTVYSLAPADFAEQMHGFVTEQGVSIVGGCCGSSPAHIRALAEKLAGVEPKQREVSR